MKIKIRPKVHFRDHYFIFYENGEKANLDFIRNPSLQKMRFGWTAYIYAFFYNHSIKNRYFNRLVVVNKFYMSWWKQIQRLKDIKKKEGKQWKQ